MISIIVPFYRTRKEYFDKCMTSLLSDSEADIEVLIVDDGSPEEFRDCFSSFLTDKRVRVIYENHRGVSNARNVGIRESSGDWLMFVDSDDYLENSYYKILKPLTGNTDADFYFFNGYGDKNGYSIKNKFFLSENVDYAATNKEKCKVMGAGLSLGRTPQYLRCFYTLGSPCSKLIRKTYITSCNILFDENLKFAEDTLFSLNLIINANHIYYADAYLYHYFMNGQSVTGKYREGLSDDVDSFLIAVAAFIEHNNLKEELEEPYLIRAFLEAQRCLRQEFCYGGKSDKANIERAKTFLDREPYYSGIRSKYTYMKRRECRVASFLLRNKMISEYMLLYKVLSMIKTKTCQ